MFKSAGLILLLAAYGLLFPGLTQPMLTVTGTVEKSDMLDVGKELLAESDTKMGFVGDMANMILNNLDVDGHLVVFDKTRSILGTVRDLFTSSNYLVAILIMTFSVIIPVLKGFLTLITLFVPAKATQTQLSYFSSAISKWSMADVFVIAMFVTYLAANGIREDRGLVQFESTLGIGFYFFLGFCLLSIVASQLLAKSVQVGGKPSTRTATTRQSRKKS